MERGLFDADNTPPQELTVIRLGELIRQKCPDLPNEDVEAVRQQAIAALSLTQQAAKSIHEGETHEPRANTALIDGVRKFVTDVRELNIDLIDRINPFSAAYAILSKAMDANNLKQIEALISTKRINLDPDEARKLAVRASLFKQERGRWPKDNSPDPWEQHLARAARAYARYKAEGKYE